MPGRAEEQHALRDLGAHVLELGRRLEELLDLLELLDRLVEAGDVGERDLRLVLGDEPRLRLAEPHDPAPAALHLAEHPHEHQPEEHEREQPEQEADERVGLLVVGLDASRRRRRRSRW